MKEIKFRYWDKGNDEVEYIHNLYFFEEEGIEEIEEDGKAEGYCETYYMMQFINTQDQNGKDVYEEDIVETDKGLGKIKYDNNYAIYIIQYLTFGQAIVSYLSEPHEKFKVVGNSFSMPDWEF